MDTKVVARAILFAYWLIRPDLLFADIKCEWHINPNIDEQSIFVSTEVLYLRANPGLNGRIKLFLSKGQRLKRTLAPPAKSKSGTWFEIETLHGGTRKKGWVHTDFISNDPMAYLAKQKKFKDVSFERQEKVCEHPSNPRRKVQGIYLTKYSAHGNRLNQFIDLAQSSAINSFVVDIKDEWGNLIHKSETQKEFKLNPKEKPLYESLTELSSRVKKNNIYLIGKVTAFKDDSYARAYKSAAIKGEDRKIYEDRDGIAWVSPHDRNYWRYLVNISKEIAKQGVNEIQFDYVRFPDSNDAREFPGKNCESKVAAIQGFLQYAYEELSPLGVYVSADVFGLTPNTSNDLNIGQHWESLSNVVDYISPMMYPSHYAKGFRGLDNPDLEPYKTIHYSARDAVRKINNHKSPATIRPWIQAFSASWLPNYLEYSFHEVKQQIQALNDLGINEYLLWNPRNKYENFLSPEQNVADHIEVKQRG